jgi:hypothetical protein
VDTRPSLPDDDPQWVRSAVYTRQSVKCPGDDPALTSCALQRTLRAEFIRSTTWEFLYPIAERFDDEGESGDISVPWQDAEKVRPWTFSAPLRRSEFGSAPGIIRLFQSLGDSAGPSWPGQAAFSAAC